MVGGNTQIVKALCGCNNRIFGIVHDVFMWKRGEVILNFGTDDTQRMIRLGVQSFTDEGGDVRRDVIVGMIG
jgi:hypothetical protein